MGTLSDKFHETLCGHEDDPKVQKRVAQLILSAPVTPESNGLMALMYHEGIGVPVNLDKSCELAEKAAFDGNDGLGYFLLGYMCDNAETLTYSKDGLSSKYDYNDAIGFYTKCSEIKSRWQSHAHLWLGDYFMDSTRGDDPDTAVRHYETIADNNSEAAAKLSDYYWELRTFNAVVPDEFKDDNLDAKIYKWTLKAVTSNPHDYSYRMGWIHADGIGCNPSFRLARKYWEDAYEFGDWRAADGIASLFEEKLESLPDTKGNESERNYCIKSISSWRALAVKTREREDKRIK